MVDFNKTSDMTPNKLSVEKSVIRNKWAGASKNNESPKSTARDLLKTAQPVAKNIVESLLDTNDI